MKHEIVVAIITKTYLLSINSNLEFLNSQCMMEERGKDTAKLSSIFYNSVANLSVTVRVRRVAPDPKILNMMSFS